MYASAVVEHYLPMEISPDLPVRHGILLNRLYLDQYMCYRAQRPKAGVPVCFKMKAYLFGSHNVLPLIEIIHPMYNHRSLTLDVS